MTHTDCKKGIRVVYRPSLGGPGFIGTVREEPWQLGNGSWVTHVCDLPPEYTAFTHKHAERTTAYGVWVDGLEVVP